MPETPVIIIKRLCKLNRIQFFPYSLFLLSLLFQACCSSEMPPSYTKYELSRFIALKDTNDIIEEIRYKQTPLVLFPDSDFSNFPVSENINTTAYIKIKSRSVMDTIEIAVQQLYLQHSSNKCGDQELIYRREPNPTIVHHTLNKITKKSKSEKYYHTKIFEIYTIE